MGRRRGRHRAKSSGRVRVFRAVGLVVACGGVALALTAFGPDFLDRSTARADQRFVAAVQAEGRTVGAAPNQALVIQAAHKVCESQVGDATVAQRRATALTADEIEAVRQTFGDDSPAFMKLARRSYCPLSR
jgi:Protein of unknown function (DUF732)